MNPKGKPSSGPDWKGLQAQASDVLGPEFWQDIASVLPVTGPRIDMYEKGDELVIVVEVPGLTSPESVKLAIHERSLLIRGTLVRPYDVLDEQMLMSERFFGAFERSIRLSGRVIIPQMRAYYHNGLLIIRLPLAPDTGETTVPIQFT